MAHDLSAARFPIKERYLFLNSCGVSALPQPAVEREVSFIREHSTGGSTVIGKLQSNARRSFKSGVAKLLQTEASNISSIRNCAEGLTMIAQGLALREGDEVLVYQYEYPSNHYPWAQLQKNGVILRYLPGEVDDQGRPLRFSREEVANLISPRTRVIALSHVQFSSGFAVDLDALGRLIHGRGIDLVIDAAQSLGCIPVYPEQCGISALVASGWKWLMGPVGSAVLYTSPDLRARIQPVFLGPDMMKQGEDYFNYTIDPYEDGRKFEYSTMPGSTIAGLSGAIEEVINQEGIEFIWGEIQRLQRRFVAGVESIGVARADLSIVAHPEVNRSGILSLATGRDPKELVAELLTRGIVCSTRAGFLRVAPHFFCTDDEIDRAVEEICAAVQRRS